MLLKIRSEFSTAPGPRYRTEGDHSGEEFREDILAPKLRQAIATRDKLTVDLDGTSGIGTSFLEESFGGLIREDGLRLADITPVLNLKSVDEPQLIDEITAYLAAADLIAGEESKSNE